MKNDSEGQEDPPGVLSGHLVYWANSTDGEDDSVASIDDS